MRTKSSAAILATLLVVGVVACGGGDTPSATAVASAPSATPGESAAAPSQAAPASQAVESQQPSTADGYVELDGQRFDVTAIECIKTQSAGVVELPGDWEYFVQAHFDGRSLLGGDVTTRLAIVETAATVNFEPGFTVQVTVEEDRDGVFWLFQVVAYTNDQVTYTTIEGEEIPGLERMRDGGRVRGNSVEMPGTGMIPNMDGVTLSFDVEYPADCAP